MDNETGTHDSLTSPTLNQSCIPDQGSDIMAFQQLSLNMLRMQQQGAEPPLTMDC